MGPLIKITSESLRLIRITEQARLLPSDATELERRKAIARRIAAQSNQSGYGGKYVPVEDIARINKTFSVTPSSVPNSPHLSSAGQGSGEFLRSLNSSASLQPSFSQLPKEQLQDRSSSDTVQTKVNASAEFHSSYTAERGSFEMRVTRGDITFVPPLTMTIITQLPEIHFEYIGGFNYFPPDDEGTGSSTFNLHT